MRIMSVSLLREMTENKEGEIQEMIEIFTKRGMSPADAEVRSLSCLGCENRECIYQRAYKLHVAGDTPNG
jgi:hypothetical protein